MKTARALFLAFGFAIAVLILSQVIVALVDPSLCPFFDHPIACALWSDDFYWKARFIGVAILGVIALAAWVIKLFGGFRKSG